MSDFADSDVTVKMSDLADSDVTVKMDNIDSKPSASFEVCVTCGSSIPAAQDGRRLLSCPGCGSPLNRSERQLGPGSVIGGRYRLLNRLSAGGFGMLYMGHPLENPGERYVIKILSNISAENRRRFRREGRILNALRHDTIVNMVDYWSDDRDSFLVLEYIDGCNLQEYRKQCEIDEESVLIIAKEIAKALQYAWDSCKLIHRDIKPANIMLDSASHIKLLDFGVSKMVDDNKETNLTVAGKGLGTPGYMAPEQYTNSKDVTIAADMFSLAASMLFLLTGERPFHGNNIREVYEDTRKNSPPDIKRICPGISPGFATLLRRMMMFNPADRPDDWGAVADELRRLLQ